MANTGNPNEFDYFRVGAVFPAENGKTSRGQFDYFRAGETTQTLDSFATLSVAVSLAGSSSLSATVQELHKFTVTLAGTSSLSSTVAELKRFTGTLAGTSSLSATVQELQRFTVTLAGSSSLTPGVEIPAVDTGCNVLLEDGGLLVAEDGGAILLESCVDTVTTHAPPRFGITRLPSVNDDDLAIALALLLLDTADRTGRGVPANLSPP